jgi:membrane protease subunit (stomatin/prohibitin family)
LICARTIKGKTVAVIDRVKFDGLANREGLVYKHPSEKLVCGTQLIVGEGQTAVFVQGGRICDVFQAGSYTINTQNLPILQSFARVFGVQIHRLYDGNRPGDCSCFA